MQEIPVERLEMADVKDNSMTLGNGTFENCRRLNNVEEGVALSSGVKNPLQQEMPDSDVLLSARHDISS
jgi:hypothetical protein